MSEWTSPNPPLPPPPEVIVPFGTVLTRVILAGGLDAVQAIVGLLADDQENATRLLNAIQGIEPGDASARTLLTAAGLDPDVILYHPDAPNA